MERKTRVAIVGCGGIAALRHIPAMKLLENAEITSYYDLFYERAKEYAAKYGGTAYENYDTLLAEAPVDAVVVCTAARSHCEMTVKALLAGKHVLCEKPMAISAGDAREMIAVSERSGCKLMVSHNQRRYEPHIRAKTLIHQGEIGQVISFRTFLGIKGPEYSSVFGVNNGYFSRAMSGRGVMSDVGAHRIDLMRYILGAEYERVFAYTPTLAKKKPDGTPIEVDDNAFVICEMRNGVVGNLVFSWTSMSGNDRVSQFFGTEGVITLYGPDHPIVVEKADGSVKYFDLDDNPAQSETVLTDIDKLFIDCIQKDETPFVTGSDGLAVIQMLDAMERSNLSGHWEAVER